MHKIGSMLFLMALLLITAFACDDDDDGNNNPNNHNINNTNESNNNVNNNTNNPGNEICDNGVDDDGDTLVDCADSDCANAPNCAEERELNCDDGQDNDGDTLTDCADPDCAGAPNCEFPTVEECGAPVEPTGHTCDVTAGSGTAVVIHGTILTDSTTYNYGQVVFDNSSQRITCVGCDCSSTAGYTEATVINCGSNVVSPALINAHDHIRWIQVPPVGSSSWVGGHGAIRYNHRNEWRKGLNGLPRISKPGNGTNEQYQWGELRQVLSGTVTLFGSGGADGFMRNVDVVSDSLIPGLDAPEYETFPLHNGGDGPLIDSGCSEYSFRETSLTPFSAYVPHVAEGVSDAARNEFICMSGTDPDGHDLLGSNSTYIHAIALNASDVALMAAEGGRVIWSPRTNIDLYGHTAPVTMMHRYGVIVGLGTDWTITGSMNMLRELQCADQLNTHQYGNYFNSYQIWKMATVNNAIALGIEEYVGDLEVGRYADISVFKRNGQSEPHRVVIEARAKDVALVLRGGDALSGDTNIISAYTTNCDTLDVCGVEKQVCVQSEAGVSLAQFTSNAGTIGTGFDDTYPLFFCDEPFAEPTCVPSREGNYTGIPSSNDADGDGIADDQDNCPHIFNPVRPMDNGQQADFDGDGDGDECDPCPLDYDTTDCTFDPNDLDGDGYPNATDNCPHVNNDQTDTDGDGMGDECDPCPDANQTNATGSSIPALRQICHPDHVGLGTSVTVRGIITAVGNNKFYMQDATATEYGGLYVFFGGGATLPVTTADIGKEVEVSGIYDQYYDQDQIANTTSVTITNQTPAPVTPLTVTPADINDSGTHGEAYEGMLVRMGSVSVSNVNPDGADDYGEMEVSDGTAAVRLDDLFFDYEGAGLRTLGQSFSSVTGIAVFTYGHRKVLPRDAADMPTAK